LSAGTVTPDSGTTSTSFTYSVIYADADDDPPASITVAIDDGEPQAMSVRQGEDGDRTNGEAYEYSTSLAAGEHSFRFAASDGTDIASGDTDPHVGPTVSSGGGGGGFFPGGGGVPPPPPGTTLVTDRMDENGRFTEEVIAQSADHCAWITIPENTRGLDADGEPISAITVVEIEDPPQAPEDCNVIGLAYDFGPEGATFDPAGTLSLIYDPSEIPAGVDETDLVIALWDDAAGEWTELVCTVDLDNNTITAEIAHFSGYTVMTFPPSVTTDAASATGHHSVQLEGSLIDAGSAASVEVSFEWGLSRGPYPNTTTPQPAAVGDFTAQLDGLQVETTYYFRAKVVGAGTAYGDEANFSLPAVAPSVTAIETVDVAERSATLNVVLEDLGTAELAKLFFEWGETPGGPYPNRTDEEIAHAAGSFSFDLDDLEPGKTYYYRVAVVSAGTTYGTESSLVTPSVPELAPPPLSPAAFSVDDFVIAPDEIAVGESAAILVRVANTGGLAGRYTATLHVNGVAVAARDVVLAAGESEVVRFEISEDVSGEYDVMLAGQEGRFRVLPPPTRPDWSWAWGAGAAVAVVLPAAFLYVRRRRAMAD
jgi:hypothetical protein